MWGVELNDILVNGKSTGVCKGRKECLITFDSGTSLMSMPQTAIKKWEAQGIPTESKGIKCSNTEGFGDLTFIIGGKKYTIENDEWMEPIKRGNLAQNEKQDEKFSLGPELLALENSDEL